MNETIHSIVLILRSSWRFRWQALVAAWAVCLLGWVFVALQQDVYEANSRFYVDTTSDLRQLLQEQIVNTDVDDHLTLVRESMLGQVQLRQVAEETGIGNSSLSEIEWQIILMELRQDIVVEGGTVDWSGQRDNLFSITYRNPVPQLAVDVVDALLSAFMEDVLGSKRSSSEAAGTFLRDQIAEYEIRLSEAEARVAEFNRANFDRLPGRQGSYFEELQAATEELESVRQRLRVARSQLSLIEQQMRGGAPRVDAAGTVDPNSLEGRILSYQTRLDDLQLRFTDDHPDVIAGREILNQLKERQRQRNEELSAGNIGPTGSNNPVFQALQISRNQAEAEISTLQAEFADRERRVARLRSHLDEMPEVEAERARLNRDYDVIRAHYQSLLNSLERDQLSREVFKSEQVGFRIVDPPTVGNRPVAPKREILLLLVFFGSFGAAGAAAFLLSQLKPVFLTQSDLEIATDLPVIGQASLSPSNADVIRGRRSIITFVGGLVCLSIVFLAIFAFEVVGTGLRGLI